MSKPQKKTPTTVKTADFARALEVLGRVIDRRNTIPVLGMVQCRLGADGLVLSGTDMDLRLDVTVPVDGAPRSEQSAMLDGFRMVGTWLRRSGAADATLGIADTDAGRQIALSAGGFDFTAAGLPPEDWPDELLMVSDADFSASFGAEMMTALAKVTPAISTEETRYYLNGVFFHKADGAWGHRVVATDGHRLHMADIALPDAVGEIPDKGIIIPNKTVAVLRHLARLANGEPVKMRIAPWARRNTKDKTLAPNTNGIPVIEFTVGPYRLRSKLIDGTFPAYEKVIPKDLSRLAVFRAGDLRRVVSVMSAWMSGRHEALEVKLNGAAEFSAMWRLESATTKTAIPYEGEFPQPLHFGVNVRYLEQALSSLAASDTPGLPAPTAPSPPGNTRRRRNGGRSRKHGG